MENDLSVSADGEETEDAPAEITGSGGLVMPSLRKMLIEHLERQNADDGE